MTLGAGYGLLALGFALTLRAAGAINFAHGDVAVAAAYSAVSAGALGLPGVLALGFATIAGALFGLGVAGVAWAPLRRRPVEATFIAAIALGIIIQNGLTVAYGGAPQVPPTIAHDGWQVGGIFVSNYAAWTLALAAAAFGAVAFVLLRTQIGRRLRAAAEGSGDRGGAWPAGAPPGAPPPSSSPARWPGLGRRVAREPELCRSDNGRRLYPESLHRREPPPGGAASCPPPPSPWRSRCSKPSAQPW